MSEVVPEAQSEQTSEAAPTPELVNDVDQHETIQEQNATIAGLRQRVRDLNMYARRAEAERATLQENLADAHRIIASLETRLQEYAVEVDDTDTDGPEEPGDTPGAG